MTDGLYDANSEEKQYRDALRRTVIEAVTGGIEDLIELTEATRGADPLLVRSILGDAVEAGMIQWDPHDRQRDSSAGRDCAVDPTLPMPHPLDFEWRFSGQGTSFLLEAIEDIGARNLVLLGATTLAIAAERSGWSGQITACDMNGLVVGHAARTSGAVRYLVGELGRDEVLFPAADAVVIDPPWYPEHFSRFFSIGASALPVGGYLLASMPGEGTRPGVMRERESQKRWCMSNGFELVQEIPQVIRYETPFFEFNAFRAAGLEERIGHWRRGDLLLFRRRSEGTIVTARVARDEVQWTDHSLDGVRFRVRSARRVESRILSITSMIDGDILPTVSRRDPRRNQVDLWTSGNRVFQCGNSLTLDRVLSAMVRGTPTADPFLMLGRPFQEGEEIALIGAEEKIRSLVSQEQNEYGLMS